MKRFLTLLFAIFAVVGMGEAQGGVIADARADYAPVVLIDGYSTVKKVVFVLHTGHGPAAH